MLVNKSERYLKGKDVSEFFGAELKKWLKVCILENKEIFNLDVGNFTFDISPLYVSGETAGATMLIKEKKELSLEPENLEEFLNGISHEIRNPLGGIKASVRLLQELSLYDEELAEVIISEVGRIERFLDSLRTAFDYTSLRIKPTNIHMLLDGILKLFEGVFFEKGILVERYYDPSLPEIEVDSDRLTQAFINIIKNAVEAMESSKEKKLTLRTGYFIQGRGMLFVSFEDSGVGMSKDELSKVFSPFATTKDRGSGLGMFITQKIIKAHGGKILLDSKKGEGTKVKVLLPTGRSSWQRYS